MRLDKLINFALSKRIDSEISKRIKNHYSRTKEICFNNNTIFLYPEDHDCFLCNGLKTSLLLRNPIEVYATVDFTRKHGGQNLIKALKRRKIKLILPNRRDVLNDDIIPHKNCVDCLDLPQCKKAEEDVVKKIKEYATKNSGKQILFAYGVSHASRIEKLLIEKLKNHRTVNGIP